MNAILRGLKFFELSMVIFRHMGNHLYYNKSQEELKSLSCYALLVACSRYAGVVTQILDRGNNEFEEENPEILKEASAQINQEEFKKLWRACLARRGFVYDLAPDSAFQDVLLFSRTNQLPPYSQSTCFKNLCLNIAKQDTRKSNFIGTLYCASMLLANYIKWHAALPNDTSLSKAALLVAIDLCKEIDPKQYSAILDPVEADIEKLKQDLLIGSFGKDAVDQIRSAFANDTTSLAAGAKDSFLYGTRTSY